MSDNSDEKIEINIENQIDIVYQQLTGWFLEYLDKYFIYTYSSNLLTIINDILTYAAIIFGALITFFGSLAIILVQTNIIQNDFLMNIFSIFFGFIITIILGIQKAKNFNESAIKHKESATICKEIFNEIVECFTPLKKDNRHSISLNDKRLEIKKKIELFEKNSPNFTETIKKYHDKNKNNNSLYTSYLGLLNNIKMNADFKSNTLSSKNDEEFMSDLQKKLKNIV